MEQVLFLSKQKGQVIEKKALQFKNAILMVCMAQIILLEKRILSLRIAIKLPLIFQNCLVFHFAILLNIQYIKHNYAKRIHPYLICLSLSR